MYFSTHILGLSYFVNVFPNMHSVFTLNKFYSQQGLWLYNSQHKCYPTFCRRPARAAVDHRSHVPVRVVVAVVGHLGHLLRKPDRLPYRYQGMFFELINNCQQKRFNR